MTPQSLLLLTIPRISKTNSASRHYSPTFVRHAVDSPRVESRLDVLGVAASAVVEHFQPVNQEPPISAPETGLYPSPKDLERATASFSRLRARCTVVLIS